MMKLLPGFLKLFRKRWKKKLSGRMAAMKPSAPSTPSHKRKAIIEKVQPIINIMVGLDFGTSTTKVAYREILVKAPTIPIVFKHGLKTYPEFCLPSLACFNDSGTLLLAKEAAKYLEDKPWNSGFRYLKVIVAGKRDSAFENAEAIQSFNQEILKGSNKYKNITAEQITAIYLAYVIKQVRKMIKNSTRYSGKELNVAFNIGIPIDYFENSPVRDSFEKVIAWAELIEREWNSSDDIFDPLLYAHKCKAQSDYGRLDTRSPARRNKEARVFAIPETIAEVSSYTTSTGVKEGLHAIIDLGAGTTDVSIFRLRRLEELQLKQFWFSSINIPRGGSEIERLMASNLEQQDSICSLARIYEVLMEICEDVNSGAILNGDKSSCYQEIRSILRDIYKSNEYKRAWRNAYDKYRGTSNWIDVHIFIAGGVASIPCVRDIFSKPWWGSIKIESDRYPVSFLPEPEDFENYNGLVPFYRMEVACGLAINLGQLPPFRMPGECGDQTPAPLPRFTPLIDYDNSPG